MPYLNSAVDEEATDDIAPGPTKGNSRVAMPIEKSGRKHVHSYSFKPTYKPWKKKKIYFKPYS
jgi:hypothetical protein